MQVQGPRFLCFLIATAEALYNERQTFRNKADQYAYNEWRATVDPLYRETLNPKLCPKEQEFILTVVKKNDGLAWGSQTMPTSSPPSLNRHSRWSLSQSSNDSQSSSTSGSHSGSRRRKRRKKNRSSGRRSRRGSRRNRSRS